jgi:hypothetical protein
LIFRQILDICDLGAISCLNDAFKIKERYQIGQTNISSITHRIKQYLSEKWLHDINNTEINPGLTLYKNIKYNLSPENYLTISNYKIRNAIARIRLSSHQLQIEKGRHMKIQRCNRYCIYCDDNAIEDEVHFLFVCPKYKEERDDFFTSINMQFDMSPLDTFICLFNSNDQGILTKLGKYILRCFNKRHM